MFSFPVPVKDLGERPLAGLLSGALLIYGWLWFLAVLPDITVRHRHPVGPATWMLQTLGSHGVDIPTWLERLLLEPRPSVWLLVVPAVLANSLRGAPYGIRVGLVLLCFQWYGIRGTAVPYLVVVAVVAVVSALFALHSYREDKEQYIRDAGGPLPPILVAAGVIAEAIGYPFLLVPMQALLPHIAGAYLDEKKRTRLEFGICDELKSTPLSTATALDLANALWLVRQPGYKPFGELTDHEKHQRWLDEFQQWQVEQQRQDELGVHLARRKAGLDSTTH